MEGLHIIIKTALTTISDETVNQIIQRLIECGVENIDDLKYIQERDFFGVLKPVQCRKLLAVFNNNEFYSLAPLKFPNLKETTNEGNYNTENLGSHQSILAPRINTEGTDVTNIDQLIIKLQELEAGKPEKQETKCKEVSFTMTNQREPFSDTYHVFPTLEISETLIPQISAVSGLLKETSNVTIPKKDLTSENHEEPEGKKNAVEETEYATETNSQCLQAKSIVSMHQVTKNDPKIAENSQKCDKDDITEYRKSVVSVIFKEALPDIDWSDTESLEASSDEEEQITEDKMSDASLETATDTKDTPFMVAAKIMMSEHNYVGTLEILYNQFYLELTKENDKTQFLDAERLSHIFCNLENIYLFHKTFLLPQMEERVKNWSQDPRLSDILRKNVPFLHIYLEYIQNYSQACSLLTTLLSNSSRFKEVINLIMKHPDCENTTLADLLKAPTNRLVSYVTLIREYASVLPKDSLELLNTNDALNMVSKIAYGVSDCKKKQESFLAMYELSKKLTGVPQDLITPTRQLVAEGPITEVISGQGSQLRHLILFNDLILICSHDKATDKYAVWAYIDIDGLEVKSLTNTFELSNEMVRCEFFDRDFTGTSNSWIKKIEMVRKKFEAKKLQRISQCSIFNHAASSFNEKPTSYLGKIRPVWVPNYVAKSCMVCQQKFTFVIRRHHCRSCGKLICKSCCLRASIQYKHSRKSLVCESCYLIIKNYQQEDIHSEIISESASEISTPNKNLTHKLSTKLSSFLPSSSKRRTKGIAGTTTVPIKDGSDIQSENTEQINEILNAEGLKLPLKVETVTDKRDEFNYENVILVSALSFLESENNLTVLPILPEQADKNQESNA